jgi:hypothetical protein
MMAAAERFVSERGERLAEVRDGRHVAGREPVVKALELADGGVRPGGVRDLNSVQAFDSGAIYRCAPRCGSRRRLLYGSPGLRCGTSRPLRVATGDPRRALAAASPLSARSLAVLSITHPVQFATTGERSIAEDADGTNERGALSVLMI